jgi:two-component system alkaline phosphatase synthesis response regulator PhoP
MDRQRNKILVIDDDETAVAFVRATLDPDRFEVIGISNGPEGLSQARQITPDLIILDVYMPGEAGYYTLQDLKNDPKTSRIPVIMLTGVSKRLGIALSTQDLYNVLGTEPDLYLEKPVDPMFLRQTVDNIVCSRHTARGPEAKETPHEGNSK